MIFIVCGDREYKNIERVREYIGLYLPELIIEGGARGVDTLANEIAKEFNIPTRTFPAHWRHDYSCRIGCNEVIGKAAGPIRNRKMLTEIIKVRGMVLAFHDNIFSSKGTKDMILAATGAMIPSILVDAKQEKLFKNSVDFLEYLKGTKTLWD